MGVGTRVSEKVRLFERLIIDQVLQIHEIRIPLCQLHLRHVQLMSLDSELEQVHTFTPLNDLVLEFCRQVGTLLKKLRSTPGLIIRK